MKTFLLIGNLKANPASQKEMLKYMSFFSRKINKNLPHTYLALPFPYLSIFNKKTPRNLSLGVQTITALEGGAHTGGVTAKMVKSCGAQFSLIGHSELRELGEAESEVASKTENAIRCGLVAVVCVGETSRDSSGLYLDIISEQIKSATSLTKKEHWNKLVIAYEPIWAIGKTEGATEQQCFEVVIVIRRTLASLAGIEMAKKVRILYGASVSEKNARSFIEGGGVDGLLVGHTSWKPETFIKLIRACHDLS